MTPTLPDRSWHFSAADRKLGHNDGRKIVAGRTLTVKGPVALCSHGLHASKRLIDALKYATGPYIWQVELSGEVLHDHDKSVATSRKAIWGYDATNVLHAFARRVAFDAIGKYWDASKCGSFPEVAMKWLETGDESLRSAAWSAQNELLTQMIHAARPKKARKAK